MRRHSRSLVRLIARQLGSPKLGAEIGVWRGQTSEGLLQTFKELTLIAVDPWETGGLHSTMPKTEAELIAGREEFLALTDFAKDRRVVYTMESVLAAALVDDGRLDLAFLDAEHTYPCVVTDIRVWYPKVRVGGLFCGHDYNGKGDRTGQFGVKPAVDEFAARYKYTINVAPCNIWWVIKK